MSTSVTGPQLIDSETLAGPDWLNLPSERTLDQWAYRGVGPPYIKVGRHRRYDPDEVRRWLRPSTARRRRSAAPGGMSPPAEEPAPKDRLPISAAATATKASVPVTIPAGLEGVGQERLRAVTMLAATITEDVAYWTGRMVDDGWPVSEARAATGRWWSSVALVAIRDGLDEGERRAAA